LLLIQLNSPLGSSGACIRNGKMKIKLVKRCFKNAIIVDCKGILCRNDQEK
jgi:hypothetical protein